VNFAGEVRTLSASILHDSAACLLRDGEIVGRGAGGAVYPQEERRRFPRRAVTYCLGAGGISTADLAYVGFYDKPLLKFERILETYLDTAPRGLRSFLLAEPL
jgi:carbamoyltransferase